MRAREAGYVVPGHRAALPRAGRMEEGRRGGEVPQRRAAVRPRGRPHPLPGPSQPAAPPCAPCAPALPGGRATVSHPSLRNPATLREKGFPPCNTPRKKKMSGDDGGDRMTYPCSSQRARSRQGEAKVSGAGGAALCPPSTSVSTAAREGPAGGGRQGGAAAAAGGAAAAGTSGGGRGGAGPAGAAPSGRTETPSPLWKRPPRLAAGQHPPSPPSMLSAPSAAPFRGGRAEHAVDQCLRAGWGAAWLPPGGWKWTRRRQGTGRLRPNRHLLAHGRLASPTPPTHPGKRACVHYTPRLLKWEFPEEGDSGQPQTGERGGEAKRTFWNEAVMDEQTTRPVLLEDT